MFKNILKLMIVMTIIFLFYPLTTYATIEDDEREEKSITDEMINALELDELNRQWEYITQQYENFLPEWSKKNLLEMIKNDDNMALSPILKGIITFILYEIIENGKLLSTLLLLTLFSLLLETIVTAFGEASVSKIAQFVIFTILIYIALQSFYLSYSYAKDVISQMSSFMIALLPLLLAIIASLGQFISVAFFQPIIIIMIQFSSVLVSNFIFPLLFIAALLMIISQLNETFKLDQLASLFRSISLTVLGVYVTILLTIMSIQGTVTAIQDGVALKTTKFITSNFVPVIGKTLTDATDTILSSALLLKNAIGVVGLIIIAIVALFPALKIAVLAFIYKLVASLLQPIGTNGIVKSLSIISQYMMYILACLIFVTIMFFLTIVIIVVSSNLPLLLR